MQTFDNHMENRSKTGSSYRSDTTYRHKEQEYDKGHRELGT